MGKTIMVRFGASIFFAACSKIFGWQMVGPGGGLENIEEPGEWWCAEAPTIDDMTPVQRQSTTPTFRRSKAPKQLALALDDSNSQSK